MFSSKGSALNLANTFENNKTYPIHSLESLIKRIGHLLKYFKAYLAMFRLQMSIADFIVESIDIVLIYLW